MDEGWRTTNERRPASYPFVIRRSSFGVQFLSCPSCLLILSILLINVLEIELALTHGFGDAFDVGRERAVFGEARGV